MGKSQLILLAYIAGLVFSPLIFKNQAQKVFRNFFLTETSAFNLAIFRIVLFGLLFASFNEEQIYLFAGLPKTLLIPPFGSQWLLDIVPFNEPILRAVYPLFHLLCFAAMIGLATRFSSLMVVMLGVYVLGIPQFFGKVNHYHHLLWFAMILTVSPCADVLSLDGIIKSFKKADAGDVSPPTPSIKYSLPIRFVWMLIGLIYFFPGFWKVWDQGFNWALGENLKYQMYQKWYELNWIPAFRIDLYPWLYKISGMVTLIFELSFIVLIFFPLLRTLAVLGGIAFHLSTNAFMRILFLKLIVCYAAFVDWQRMLHILGNKIFPVDLFLIYDGNCHFCRRMVASLRTIDFLNRVQYVNAFDPKTLENIGLDWLNSGDLLKDMHAVSGKKVYRGFYAYRALVFRIPFLWPILPLLFLGPVAKIGNRIYRHVADSRSCQVNILLNPAKVVLPNGQSVLRLPIFWVGLLLLVVNSNLGFRGETHAWPFACYPTFAYIAQDRILSIEIAIQDYQGQESTWDEHSLQKYIPSEKLREMLRGILSPENANLQKLRLRGLRKLLTQKNENFKTAKSVSFYRVSYAIEPGKNWKNPLTRELIYTMNF